MAHRGNDINVLRLYPLRCYCIFGIYSELEIIQNCQLRCNAFRHEPFFGQTNITLDILRQG